MGLWEYAGDSSVAPPIREVVVKISRVSSRFSDYFDPMREGRLMEELAQLRSVHILRIFGKAVEDVQSDDEGPMNVVRLFLEYCPGGDVTGLLNNGNSPKIPSNPFAESDLWAIFYCLALGCSVMDRGTELNDGTSWNRDTMIAHNE